jgi:hypothetical protein
MKKTGYNIKIEIPNEMAVHINDVDYVNNCLTNYWNTNNQMLMVGVEGRLLGLKTEYENAIKYPTLFTKHYSSGDIENVTGTFRSYLRLAAGYNMLFESFGIKTLGFQLYSKAAYKLKVKRKMGKKVTSDHIFGTTEMGVQAFTTYKNSDWDIDYMTNEWLPANLFLNMECKILVKEHQKENKNDVTGVARGKHTLVEKISLNHYKESNIPLPLIVGT